MSDPHRARQDGADNLVRTLGLSLCWLGLIGIAASAIEFGWAILGDRELHMVKFFFGGLVALILGWSLLSTQKRGAHGVVSVDCGQCGAINDAARTTCRACGAAL